MDGQSRSPRSNRTQSEDTDSQGLSRSLNNRQMRMLAIGGVIGVGLFYGASLSVKLAGPAVLIDFAVCGFIVAIVMRALSEMTVESPTAGSFSHYATKHLGQRMGFITGGMWWFYWVATVMSELAAIGSLLQYWFPTLPAWLPGLVALLLFTLSNLLMVRVFGELEYWFSFLKVLTIAVFMAFGALIILTGAFNHGQVVGLTNLWRHGGFMAGGFTGVMMAISLVVQAYSGIETLAVEAGESANPAVTIRSAFRSVTWRIVVLYVGSMLIMLCAFPWTYLQHHAGSPYVLMFAKIGIPFAAGLINLIIVLSGLSSCNTGLYGGSRMLFSLARRGEIATGLGNLNRSRVPSVAVVVTALAISVGILITYLSPNHVYVWITSASAFASIWTWGVILVTEMVARRRLRREGRHPSYPMPLWPWSPALGLVLLVLTFAAIVASPLTRLSVFSGLVWLVILWLYSLRPSRRQE